jgi:hypothetical protein
MIERSPTTPCLNVPQRKPVTGLGSNSAEDEEEDAVGVGVVVGVVGGICRLKGVIRIAPRRC